MDSKKTVIVWFRQDLRIHDNEALTDAIKHGDTIIPVYIFDDRIFKGTTRFGFNKTDKFRAKFIIESVQNLRKNLKSVGSDLIVRIGIPEDILFDIAHTYKSSWVFCNRERTYEEVKVQDALEKKLWSIGQEMRYSRGKMLYYTQDLPFPITHMMDTFTQFRKEVEKVVHVRNPLPTVDFNNKTFPEAIDTGKIPSLKDLGHDNFVQDKRTAFPYEGGEDAALKRLQYYLWETKAISTYKKTRNGLIGDLFSSKFSPWLAQGCISPKTIYHEIKKYETQHGANESTYWLFFELMWRDFFRLIGKKYDKAIFLKGGIKNKVNPNLENDRKLLNLWIDGRTGIPFIDANMIELKLTGFMSNRGRQNVASFLINDLHVNWQMGASYFESMLIDYDPCSNWCNWNYIAGVGCDPKANRYFNIMTQAKKYDHNGEYVKYWLPALIEVPCNVIHRPHVMSTEEQELAGVRIGYDYPRAMVNLG